MNINKLLYDPEDFGINHYQWRADGKLDVFQNVELSSRGLDSLPFSFGKVEGVFEASENNLKESSLSDLPENCEALILRENKFKNLNEFHTKTDELNFHDNSLESIQGIEEFKFKTLNLMGCNKIKDWDKLPFVKDNLFLRNSSAESLFFLKNKKLKYLMISDTKIKSVDGLEVDTLFITQTEISTLKDISRYPIKLFCDKEREDQFINELKEKFPTAVYLPQVSWKTI